MGWSRPPSMMAPLEVARPVLVVGGQFCCCVFCLDLVCYIYKGTIVISYFLDNFALQIKLVEFFLLKSWIF
jgi:hypothetical protein